MESNYDGLQQSWPRIRKLQARLLRACNGILGSWIFKEVKRHLSQPEMQPRNKSLCWKIFIKRAWGMRNFSSATVWINICLFWWSWMLTVLSAPLTLLFILFYFLVFRDMAHSVMYTYQVQTLSRWGDSEPSPPLFHRLGTPYCGDGIIQRYVYVTHLQFHHYHQAEVHPNLNDDHMHAALY